MEVNKRRLIIRVALVALLVLLCFFLYYIGKEHNVYLDNKTVTIEGRQYEEIEYLSVVIDGNEKGSVEYFAGDRDMVKLRGPNHTIKIVVMDEDTEEVIKTVERKLSLGTVPAIMLSIPAMADEAANAELPLPRLQIAAPAPSADEEAGGMEAGRRSLNKYRKYLRRTVNARGRERGRVKVARALLLL